MKRRRVAPKLGAEVNIGEGPVGGKLDGVVLVGMEGGDEVAGVVVKSIPQGDELEEVTLEVFFLRGPDLLTAFVDDGVLVGMAVVSSGARQGGEEVREELGFVKAGERKDGENGSGRTWGGDMSNGGGGDGQREVLNWDIGKRDALDDFFKLAMGVLILVLGL
jgi:hypothetical protein